MGGWRSLANEPAVCASAIRELVAEGYIYTLSDAGPLKKLAIRKGNTSKVKSYRALPVRE